MYVASVAVLLFVLPVVSVIVAVLLKSTGGIFALAGIWFVFWACVRLFIAGIRQVAQPQFTARSIFKITGTEVVPVVREIGFANLSMGLLGIAVVAEPSWLLPAALVSGLYYGCAGLGHVFVKNKNFEEGFAMYSDFAVFGILLVVFVANLGSW